jgi:hypothetical protein
MDNVRYLVAANLVYDRKLIAAAVVYSSTMEEPSFAYTLHGRSRTAFLYRRGDRVPVSLYSALNDHIRNTAVSWAIVTAHLRCPPEAALALAVVRAVERWVCRQDVLPSLAETCVLLPTKKPLVDLPSNLKQVTNSKDWHTSSARALCRYRATKEQ